MLQRFHRRNHHFRPSWQNQTNPRADQIIIPFHFPLRNCLNQKAACSRCSFRTWIHPNLATTIASQKCGQPGPQIPSGRHVAWRGENPFSLGINRHQQWHRGSGPGTVSDQVLLPLPWRAHKTMRLSCPINATDRDGQGHTEGRRCASLA